MRKIRPITKKFDGWECQVRNREGEVSLLFSGHGTISRADFLSITKRLADRKGEHISYAIEDGDFESVTIDQTVGRMIAQYICVEKSKIRCLKVICGKQDRAELLLKDSSLGAFESSQRAFCAAFDSTLPNYSEGLCVRVYWNKNLVQSAFDIASSKHFFLDKLKEKPELSTYTINPQCFFDWDKRVWKTFLDPGFEEYVVREEVQHLLEPTLFRQKLKHAIKGQDLNVSQCIAVLQRM